MSEHRDWEVGRDLVAERLVAERGIDDRLNDLRRRRDGGDSLPGDAYVVALALVILQAHHLRNPSLDIDHQMLFGSPEAERHDLVVFRQGTGGRAKLDRSISDKLAA